MGILKQIRGGKARWCVSRRLPANKLGMKRFRRWYEKKAVAVEVLGRLNGAIATGTIDVILPGLVGQGEREYTLNQFWPVFLEQYCKPRMSSWARYQQSMNFILEELGGIQLREFQRSNLDKFLEARIKRVSRSTANKDIAALKKMFSYAAAVGAVLANPLTRYPTFKVQEKALTLPTIEEFHALVEAMPTAQLAALVAVLGETGMRRNEALDLTWSRLDFRNRKVIAEKTKGKKVRSIPLTDYAIGKLGQLVRIVGNPNVFVYDYGSHMGKKLRKPYKRYRAAAESVGLAWVTFHTLRHMRGTLWLQHGADIRDVQLGLGHATITTTMRYLKHTETTVDKALRNAQERERVEAEREKSGRHKNEA